VVQWNCVGLDFYPQDSSFNRANALYMAHASDVAYHRSPTRAARERLGLDALPFRNKVTRTRGYLGVCDTHAVLAFRGSDPVTLPNWVTDMVTQLVRREHYDGRVHLGFSSALKRTWGKVQRALDLVADRPLFLTGHSMGGALAVLTACRLARAGTPPVAVYTYGSPRVGDRAFCVGYRIPTYRVVNRLDLVPEMPLASLKRLLPGKPVAGNGKFLGKLKQVVGRVPCYGHVKTLVYIDMDGEVTVDAEVEPWHAYAVARVIATKGKSFHEGITDHLIGNYIRGLEGQARMKAAARRRA
jgi:dienelactone hydrolase